MKNIEPSILFKSAIVLALASSSAMAVNSNYAPGDLILYFQQEGGVDTVYANLGNAATLFRGSAAGPGAANMVDFKSISAELEAAFGTEWASDETVYAGLAAVWGTDPDDESLQDGDPHRTLYVSKSRASVGTVGASGSSAWTLNTDTGISNASNNIFNQNNILEQNYSLGTVVSPVGVSRIDEQNPFTAPGVPGAGFGSFNGGVQQRGTASTFGTFGAAGSVEFALDLYRIVARNDISGQVAGVVRQGSYEGTVTINSSGQVSFISQGAAPTSAYDTWMSSFTTITVPADKLPGADPDKDGATNLEEFGFGGNPESPSDHGGGQVLTVDANADTQKDITLTLEVRSGATFSASGNDLVSSPIDEVTYLIEGSTDLINWDSAVSEVTPALGSGTPSSGYEFKTFRLNAGNGLSGKGFLRASVTK